MSSPDQGTTWFLAQFKPNSHGIAERNLARQGFPTFLPLREETGRAHGRFVTRMRPFFPGYIFVALDMLRGGWRAVNSTPGITRLVSLGNEPTPVPHDLVGQLMQRCDLEGKMLPTDRYASGDVVTVNTGPFADFVGRVERIAADRRVHVLLELMGKQTRVMLNAQHLRSS